MRDLYQSQLYHGLQGSFEPLGGHHPGKSRAFAGEGARATLVQRFC